MNTSDIVKLPVQERLRVMEAIWSSLQKEGSEDLLMPAWHEQELDQRLARLDSGQEQMMSLQQAKASLQDDIASRQAERTPRQ
jgi:putative addiction module component (TIGR02574 family)